MNNLDLILESIREKCEEDKNQILTKAEDEAKNLLEEATARAKKDAEKILEDADKQKALILSNEALSAERQARDIKIAGKNKLIDRVLEKLQYELTKLDKKKYRDFVLNRISNQSFMDSEILLQEGMEDALSQEDLKGIKVSHETVREGFVIRDNKVSYDNTFSSIIDYDKDVLKKIISDELFEKGSL